MAMSMTSIPPPAGDSSTPPKIEAHRPRVQRPRYLVVALVLALFFGAGCWTEGCGRLAFYRGDPDVLAEQNERVKDDQDRAKVEAAYQRFLDAADTERGRSIPFAAGIFVLGAALLALGARGLAGKSNTRSALMQVVAAQAIVVAASYFATKNLHQTERDWHTELMVAQQREAMSSGHKAWWMPPPAEFEESLTRARSTRNLIAPTWLVIRSVASVLILVALSRQRAREFFEAAGEPQPDQS